MQCVHLWIFFFQAEDGIRHGHVTGVQTCALPICSWSTIDRYDIHQRRDCPAQAARAKEIVAGADQSKATKAAPARGHQDCTVGMTSVIAAKQKWCVRKMMPLLYREGTIPLEECPAKAFESETA